MTATRCWGQAQYGGLYSEQNVVLSGIHTHSGPGGYLEYVLYDITSLGFVRQSFDALVDGIMQVSVDRHLSLAQHDMMSGQCVIVDFLCCSTGGHL